MNLLELTTKLTINYGWSIIPVNKDTKRPLIEWKEYQKKIADIHELELWFKDKTTQDISVGLVTGSISDLVVLDSDDGSEFPLGLDSELKSKTGRGYHLFYKYEKGIRNSVNIKNKRLDIRGEGGYVIIPPSVHPSGKEYKWVKKGEPGKLPSIIKSGGLKKNRKYDWQAAFNIKEGSRNQQLYKGACSLFAKGFKQKEVLNFVNGINKTFNPPLKPEEVLNIFNSARKHERKDGIKVAMPRKISQLTEDWLEMREEELTAPSTGYPSLDNIISGFIPRHLYTLTAETNAGKTQLAVNFAVNLAEQKKKVAYIALEPDINIITAIKACIANVSYKEAPTDLTTDYIDIFLQEDIPNYKTLKATINNFAKEYSLVIVDHIGYFGNAEDKYTEQGRMLHGLATLAKTSKSAFLIIAHPRKRNKRHQDPILMDDIAGSAAFKQDSTEVLILNRKKNNPENEFDETFEDIGILVVAKKKVTNNSNTSFLKLRFSNNTVRIVDLDAIDNTKLVEKIFNV